MIVRAALFACAVTLVSFAQPALAETAPAQCEAASVRVYFAPGSAVLNRAGSDVLNAAARQMSGCTNVGLYVHSTGDALSRARGQAVLAALRGRAWEEARVDAGGMQRVNAGPEFVEVVMSVEPVTARDVAREAGV